MAVWAAVLDGVNDRATVSSVTTSNNIDIEVVMTFNSLNGGAILSDGGVANFFRYNAGTLRFRCLGFLGSSMSFTPVIGQKYTLGAALRSTGVELFVDGSSIGTSNGSPTGMLISTIGFFNSTFYLGCTIERLTVTDNTTTSNSFDLYNDVVAGSSVNWPDQTANAINGTLVNTPTDGSQWLEVGGQTGVDVQITESYSDFSESITATITPDVNISIQITESYGDFSESISVSVVDATNIQALITESYSDFTELVNTEVARVISTQITESYGEFSESVTVNVLRDIDVSITESYADFNESVMVSLPVNVTINTRNTLKINKQSNRVTIQKTNNVIKVR